MSDRDTAEEQRTVNVSIAAAEMGPAQIEAIAEAWGRVQIQDAETGEVLHDSL